MNAKQKAALKVLAEMLADQIADDVVSIIESEEPGSKQEARDSFQSFAEDGAGDYIEQLNETLENEMFKFFNRKAKQYVASMGKK